MIEVRGERWRFETALAWDVEALCSRHMALVRRARLSATRSSEHAGNIENVGNAGARFADFWNPSQWPSGALRATPPEAPCPLCRVLSGWDVVRQEGLLRAAGKTPLVEDITVQLREALKGRQTALCLPHWRDFTATADSAALETLLGWQFRSVWALQDRLDEATRQQTIKTVPTAKVRMRSIRAAPLICFSRAIRGEALQLSVMTQRRITPC